MNPDRIFRNLSRGDEMFHRSKADSEAIFGESCRELSRLLVKDLASHKSINNKHISLYSINPSRVHSHARAMGVRVRTRARARPVKDFQERFAPAHSRCHPGCNHAAHVRACRDQVDRDDQGFGTRPRATRGHKVALGGSARLAERYPTRQAANRYFPKKCVCEDARGNKR